MSSISTLTKRSRSRTRLLQLPSAVGLKPHLISSMSQQGQVVQSLENWRTPRTHVRPRFLAATGSEFYASGDLLRHRTNQETAIGTID